MSQLTKITRRGLGLLSAAFLGVATMAGVSPAFAASSVGWLNPANNSVFPVGTMVMPDGQASASGTIGGGLDIVLALDSSGSMGGQVFSLPGNPTLRQLQQDAANALIDALPAGTRVGVVDFDSNAFVAQGLTAIPGGSASLKSAVAGIDSSGGTDIRDGIEVAANELTTNGASGSNKQILLISDGDSTQSTAVAAATAAAAQGITVNTVGFPGTNPSTLQAVANAGGGTFTNFSNNAQDIIDIFSGAGGGVLVGVSSVEITDPDGNTTAATVNAVGGFKAGAYNLKAGNNTWKAVAKFTDGSERTAFLTLVGQDGTPPPPPPPTSPIPLPASAILLGAALMVLPLRRRRRS